MSNAGELGKKQRRIMRRLKIDEISFVDRPAQEGALAVLMKRDESPEGAGEGFAKDLGFTQPVLTSSERGHSHLMDAVGNGGYTSYADGHQHPWVRDEDGDIVIGEAAGHTHAVEAGTYKSLEPAGDKENGNMTLEQALAKIADMEKANKEAAEKAAAELAEAKALAGMTDAEKAFHATLKGDEAKGFLAKSATERAALVEAAKSEDPVVYKSLDGVEFRKSDSPALIAAIKRADKNATDLAKANEKIEKADLEKRAGEMLGNVAGDLETRAAIVKAVDGIADEDLRKKAHESLKAANAAAAGAFTRKGTSAVTKDGSAAQNETGMAKADAESKLDVMAKEYHKSHPNLSYEAAYDEVTQTPEGRALYEQTLAA